MANAQTTDFTSTLASANAAQAPASPLGNFPELAGYFRSRFQLPGLEAASGASAAVTQADVNNSDNAAKVAREAQIQALKDKASSLQDAVTGKNYKQVLKPDGGYDYYDPLGNRIPLNQYSQATGKQPTEILAHSQNASDIQHNKDFTNLQNLLNIYTQGDKTARDKFVADHPDIAKSIKGLTPDDLIRQFRQAYPNIYGNGNAYNSLGSGSVRSAGQSLYHTSAQ